ncbi:hypothetical protein HWV62_28294 [Athelia sp. TMB]|nr:hypothetical protein HWV62_28294 [Athelia sp. TMB]
MPPPAPGGNVANTWVLFCNDYRRNHGNLFICQEELMKSARDVWHENEPLHQRYRAKRNELIRELVMNPVPQRPRKPGRKKPIRKREKRERAPRDLDPSWYQRQNQQGGDKPLSGDAVKLAEDQEASNSISESTPELEQIRTQVSIAV